MDDAREQAESAGREGGGEDGQAVAGEAAGDLGGVRELILKAYPDAVAEMIAGDTVDALLASVPAAREAYSRVAATIQPQPAAPSPIPTGSGRRPPIDPEGLSPEAKIRAGLRRVSL